MPLPMVHLAVAYDLHGPLGRWPTPEFLLGSLAPDAIHMRPDTSRADKNVTHFRSLDGADTWPAPVRDWLAGWPDAHEPLREYLRGYAAHVLTDRAWYLGIVESLRSRLSREMSEAALRRAYYRDLDRVDLSLYRAEPWRPEAWRLLAAAQPADLPGLLTAEEVDMWRRRTLTWYDDPAHDPGVEPIYIDEARTRRFVREAVEMVARLAEVWEEW